MKRVAKAGYSLEFETAEIAERALAICDEVAADGGWQDKALLNRATVHVKQDTPVDGEEFGTDGFDAGHNLFQDTCFRLAQRLLQASFEGTCRYQDEAGMRLRITAHCADEELRFVVRKTTRERIGFWRLAWYRREDGTFEESLLNNYREVMR